MLSRLCVLLRLCKGLVDGIETCILCGKPDLYNQMHKEQLLRRFELLEEEKSEYDRTSDYG